MAQAGKRGKKKNRSAGKKGQQGTAKKPAKARRKKQANPARRRRQRRVAALLAIAVLIAVGAWFSVTVLFKINKYEIQGDVTMYSEEQIMDAFGHALGDNLYGFSVANAQERLTTKLPYIESADIKRRPPSTVIFQLTMAEEAYYLPWEGAYAVLNSSGKVLRTTNEAPEGVVRIDGLSCLVVEPGYPISLDEAAVQAAVEEKAASQAAASASAASVSAASSSGSDASASSSSEASSLSAESQPASVSNGLAQSSSASGTDGSAIPASGSMPADGAAVAQPQAETASDPSLAADSFDVLWDLLDALKKSGLEDITWIDVRDPLQLRFGWQDRITVELGPTSGIDEKMKALLVLLRDHLEEADRGTVDMTLYLTTGECIFTPE